MNNLVVTTRTEAKQLATKEDLRTLARFVDPKAQAVSFYFRLGSATDNSHRREIVLMKDMVRNIAAGFPRGPQEAGILHDLDALLAVTDELREAPSYLVAIFACFEQQTWHEFRLPALSDVTCLEARKEQT